MRTTQSFQSTCESFCKPFGFDSYCASIAPTVEKIKQIALIKPYTYIKNSYPATQAAWTWSKTGDHFGTIGQVVLVALTLGIAYNLYTRFHQRSDRTDKAIA